MQIRTLLSRLAVLGLLLPAACGRGGRQADVPVLLHSVSSRAVVVACLPRGAAGLEALLDSASVFRRLDYGSFAHSEMVLSYEYGGALVPLLSVDLGRAGRDTSERVRALMDRAGALGLKVALCSSYAPGVRRSALLLSPSQTAVGEAESHILAGSSILDIPEFAEAAGRIDAARGTVLLRSDAALRWLPGKEALPQGLARRSLAGFIAS